ncbi:hypothetical protein Bbelb_328270 [Branchiostoma belcheri]|nr:hypothetical protein Bbelb_328270 [Branchiostoma belcheri]
MPPEVSEKWQSGEKLPSKHSRRLCVAIDSRETRLGRMRALLFGRHDDGDARVTPGIVYPGHVDTPTLATSEEAAAVTDSQTHLAAAPPSEFVRPCRGIQQVSDPEVLPTSFFGPGLS